MDCLEQVGTLGAHPEEAEAGEHSKVSYVSFDGAGVSLVSFWLTRILVCFLSADAASEAAQLSVSLPQWPGWLS